MNKLRRIFTLLVVISLITIVYIFSDAHRSRAALIPTDLIEDRTLFDEFDSVNGLRYHFEEDLVTKEYSHLIPEDFKQKNVEQLEAFLEWFISNYYAPVFKVENYTRLSPEYPDLLIEQYQKKAEKGSCFNDAILFSFFAQVTGYKVRQVHFINKDGYGGSGHTMVEVWLNSLKKWAYVDIRNSAMFYENSKVYSALELREKVLTLDSANFYENISIVQFKGFNTADKDLYRFYKSNCSDFAVSAFNNPQTKVATSYFYKFTHLLSERETVLFEKGSRFLRSIFDKTRVNYLLIDEYSGTKKYNLWYYTFNVAVLFVLAYVIFIGIKAVQFFRSKLKRY